MNKRIHILGTPVDLYNLDQALEHCSALLRISGPATCILASNPEKVLLLQERPDILPLFEEAALVLPDGIGVVLAAKLLYGTSLTRITGIDFMLQLCRLAAKQQQSVYLLGARDEVNQQAAKQLQQAIPMLGIAGRQHGYFEPGDDEAVVRHINDSGAAVLLCGMGSPLQEQWLLRHRTKLQVRLCQGVGGSFDVLAGTVPRAPELFRHAGFEWLFRLAREPKRILRQRRLPRFAWQVLQASMRSSSP